MRGLGGWGVGEGASSATHGFHYYEGRGMARCSTGSADYKFQVSCPCGLYTAKPKHRCPTAVLTKWHLNEILNMIEQHKYNNESCKATRPIGDDDIWCYADEKGCDWIHEAEQDDLPPPPSKRLPSRSRSPMSSDKRSQSVATLLSQNVVTLPTRGDIKNWVKAPGRTSREISMVNVIAAVELANRMSDNIVE